MQPIKRHEYFLAKLAGMDVELPEPVTRYDHFLKGIIDGHIAMDAITVKERLMKAIVGEETICDSTGRIQYHIKECGDGDDDECCFEHVTREEKWWHLIMRKNDLFLVENSYIGEGIIA